MVTYDILIILIILSLIVGMWIGALMVSSIMGKTLEKRKQRQKQTQFDRIKKMSIEELAEFICGIYDYEYDSPVYNEVEDGKHICGDFIPAYDEDKIKQWLESEVEGNGLL